MEAVFSCSSNRGSVFSAMFVEVVIIIDNCTVILGVSQRWIMNVAEED